MNAFNIIKTTTRSFVGKACSGLRKNSPTIMVVAGSVGVIAGVVLAIKAGKESDEKTKQARKDLDYVRSKKVEATEEPTSENEAECYTKMDYAKDLTHAYLNVGLAYVRVYGPAVATSVVSLFLILTSHRMLKKENALTYASLLATSKAYDQYRKNVIAAEGTEADERYRFGIKAIDRERALLDKNGNPKLDKEGNPKKVIDKVNVLENDMVSDIRSVLWDETTAHGTFDNSSSTNDFERYMNNLHRVLVAQASANTIMQARAQDPRNNGIGFIYLNEVLAALGVKSWDIGQIVGWRYDPRLDIESTKYDPRFEAPDDWGDNRVDFGLSNPDIPGYEQRRAFVDGYEEAVLLYLNYDGPIYDKIGMRTTYTAKRRIK